MPRTKTPKEPKVPSWSVWKHKEGWVTTNVKEHLRKYDYARRLWVATDLKEEDFEAHNPNVFRHRAAIAFHRVVSGRSRLNFIFKDLEHDDVFYTMLPQEFQRLMTTVTFYQGAVHGIWKFAKKGSTTAIYMEREIEDEEDAGQSI